MPQNLAFFHCLTPLHNGAGEGLNGIDRPIIRERSTGYPYLQSSTIKGSVKAIVADTLEVIENEEPPSFRAAFGHSGADGNQGCVAFTDAQLLLLPVRSLAGTFSWATSRFALARLQRWLMLCRSDHPLLALLETVLEETQEPGDDSVYTCSNGKPQDGTGQLDDVLRLGQGSQQVCLENLILEANPSTSLGMLARQLSGFLAGGDAGFWGGFFCGRLALLGEDNFRHLVQHSTPVEPNIKIGKSGVTETGSLRYTEFLPAESLLYSLLDFGMPMVDGVDNEDLRLLLDPDPDGYFPRHRPLQFGADESKGKGLVLMTLDREGEAADGES